MQPIIAPLFIIMLMLLGLVALATLTILLAAIMPVVFITATHRRQRRKLIAHLKAELGSDPVIAMHQPVTINLDTWRKQKSIGRTTDDVVTNQQRWWLQ